MRRRLQVKELLLRRDLPGLHSLARRERNLISGVAGLLNETDDLLRWRAIEAFGRMVGEMARDDEAAARDQIRRQLWSMTEESGNQAWHAPEAIAEVLYHSAALASEFAVIVIQQHEEPIFRPGALHALGRLGPRYAELLRGSAAGAIPFLADENPLVRGHAAWALGELRVKAARSALQQYAADVNAVALYDFGAGELIPTTVGKLVQQALRQIG